ncbi:MAG TPA: glycosyltransferase [Anaerolineae bacterium]|nr:glycosyltransferase [Anaerolineae bacterium]
MGKIRCSVGITAYNEAANIGRLLERMLAQKLKTVELSEIIVVASGCTDGTEGIVEGWVAKDNRIKLLVQAKREGKASAINWFLREAAERVAVICSADLLPEFDALENLVAPFVDGEVGVTGSRPVPVNDKETFMGFAAHLLWGLHHHISLESFKGGEMIAFQKVFERIPYETAVDEASVEPIVRGQGFRVQYIPTAIVYNKGPDTINDFLRQRRRIYAGHLWVREQLGYSVSTMSGLKILGLLLRHLEWRPRPFVWTWCVVALEVYGRFLGWRDHRSKKDHSVWEIAQTTKELKAKS